MDWRSLKILNITTAIAILLILIIGWFSPSYAIFGTIAGVLLWLAIYLNLRKSILDFIATYKSSKFNIDPEREKKLAQIQFCIYALGLFISVLCPVFAWVYMHSQFIWAIFFAIGVMLLASFHNLFLTVTYLIAKKPITTSSRVAIIFFFYFLALIFMLMYMRGQLLYSVVLLLLILFADVLLNARDAVNVLKIINNKPIDMKKERLTRIISYLPIIAIILLLLMAYSPVQVSLLNLLLIASIGPLIVLMIVANVWKFIYDIS
jgi:hypothetical protein